MSPVVQLLLVLPASPLVILILHIIIHRLLSRVKPSLTGHASAMLAIAVQAVVVAAFTWRLLAADPVGGPLEVLAGVIYSGAVYGAMSLLYINAINIAETSLHMHTLLEVSWAGSLDEQALMNKYNADKMIAARLERLVSLGQIRVGEDRYYLGGRWLLYFAEAVDFWRRVIGVPPPAIMAQVSRR
jgi:hypothetical protein